MSDEVNFIDEVSTQIDKRKLGALVDAAKITAEQLVNAPIVFMCECGCEQDIDNEVCDECGKKI